MFQILSTGQRVAVANLNGLKEITEIYYSESNKHLVKNARSKLSSFDLKELPCLELSNQEFDEMLVKFKNVTQTDT